MKRHILLITITILLLVASVQAQDLNSRPFSYPPSGIENGNRVGPLNVTGNISATATRGTETITAPMVSGGWTLGTDTGGWAIAAGVLSKTASTGTLSATATSGQTTAPVAGSTYEVVIVASACSGTVTVTMGGVTLGTITALGTHTLVLPKAEATTKLALSGPAATTCTITSISVKMYVDATGDAIVDGNLTLKSPMLGPDGTEILHPVPGGGVATSGPIIFPTPIECNLAVSQAESFGHINPSIHLGLNRRSSGPSLDINEPSLTVGIESDYYSDAVTHWMEYNIDYFDKDGTNHRRPITWSINKDTHVSGLQFRSAATVFYSETTPELEVPLMVVDGINNVVGFGNNLLPDSGGGSIGIDLTNTSIQTDKNIYFKGGIAHNFECRTNGDYIVYLIWDGVAVRNPITIRSTGVTIPYGSLIVTANTIINSSGTGFTLVSAGHLNRQLYKATLAYTAFSDTDTTKGKVVGTLPAKCKLVGAYSDTTTKFVGGAISAATLKVGVTAEGGAEIIAAHDVFTAAVVKGLADADLGTSMTRAAAIQGGYMPSWTGTTDVYATIDTTDANTNALTQGSVTIYLETEQF